MAVARIKPAVNQVESHPYFQQPKMLDFLRSQNIVMTAYSPLGTGAAIQGTTIATHPVLHEIGLKYERSAAQVK